MQGKRGDCLSRYLRQAGILSALALGWELLARLNLWPRLLFPPVTDILLALIKKLDAEKLPVALGTRCLLLPPVWVWPLQLHFLPVL